MTSPILAVDDLTVLGGPTSINVEVDFGPEGPRGSMIYTGIGNPNNNAPDGDVQLLDLYINIDPQDPDKEYGFLYQYQVYAGSNTWRPLMKLLPNTYSNNYNRTFDSNGETTINIPVVTITGTSNLSSTLSSEQFNVQYSILNSESKVMASNISVREIFTDGDIVSLPIDIKASEFDGTNWTPVQGLRSVHLLINVV